MTDSTAAALADFSTTWPAKELMNERAQQEALRRAREAIPELDRLLDDAVTTVRASLAVVVEGFPTDAEALVIAAAALGQVDPSHNGPNPDSLVHHVVDSEARPYHDPDPFHTDSPLLPRPHAYLGLLCVRPSPAGDGLTVLAGVADIAAEIADADHLRALQDPSYPFAVPPGPGSDEPSVTEHPILTTDGEGTTVRYCPVRVPAGLKMSGHAPDEEHLDALQTFERALEAPHLSTVFPLRAGELLFLDNRRLLHGRTDVGPDGVGRHLMRVKVQNLDGQR